MKNGEVISYFLSGDEAKGGNIFCEHNNGKRVLFSYGYHFPLCVILKDGQFFINSESYSMTTATHKGDLARALGYDNFKILTQKDKEILFCDSDKLNEIIRDENINSRAEFIANKI